MIFLDNFFLVCKMYNFDSQIYSFLKWKIFGSVENFGLLVFAYRKVIRSFARPIKKEGFFPVGGRYIKHY